MLRDSMIGQYFPGDSLLHRLDPRIKIIALMLILIAVFLADSVIGYGIVCLTSTGLLILSGVPLRMMFKAVKPLWIVIVFTALIHIFSTPGEAVAAVGAFSITKEGVKMASFMALRLLLLILVSSLLTFTTTPITLTDALERLLNPFKRLGIPAHELAMMMTIALRFIPTLLEETERIMKAQESRGADFTTGNLFRRVKNMVPIFVPLFISAFRRADDLAVAMEARCYRGGENRTRMRILKISSRDYIALLLAAVLTVVMAGVRWFGL